MKRIFCVCLLLFLLPISLAVPKKAEADSGVYAVAASRDVWFYAEADESKGLFILPYTYYVRVIADGEPFCFVEYQDGSDGFKRVTGYCRREALTFVDFVPSRPYLKKQITLTYNIGGNTTGAQVGSGALGNIERAADFYGTYYAGTALYYYVCADGLFDYVPAVQAVNYDLNTDYLASASGEAEAPAAEEQGGVNGLQIAVICLLSVAAVAVAVFVIRGKRPPVSRKEEQADF